MFYLIMIMFFGVPLLALIWFIYCLVKFVSAPKGSDERSSLTKDLITSAVVAGVLLIIIISIISLFYVSILNM